VRWGVAFLKPVTWLAASLTAGILLADWIRPHPALPLAGLFFLLPVCLRWPRAAAGAALLCGVLLQSAHGTLGPGTLDRWAGETVRAVGRAEDAAEKRFALQVTEVDGTPARGRLSVYVRSGDLPPEGAAVAVRGRLSEFRGALRMTAAGIEVLRAPGLRPAAKLRALLDRTMRAGLPPHEAALLAGLLFGSREQLPPAWVDSFKRAGVYHVLAASGSNVRMILVVPLFLLARFDRRLGVLLVIPLALLYWALTAGEPSISRATVMVTIALLGTAIGRAADPLASLSAAVLLLLALDPGLLRNIGFQLSVGATAGILLLTGPLQKWLQERCRLPALLAVPVAVTLAAQAGAEPLMLYHFGQTSPVAPVANLPVGWILTFLVPAGCILLIPAILFPALLVLIKPGLWLLVRTVDLFAAIPGAFLYLPPLPWYGVLLWYGAMLLAVSPAIRLHRPAAAVVAAMALLSWSVAYAAPSGVLRVTFLDVGQGDAILLQAPDGSAMLIDAGPATEDGYDAGDRVVLPALRRAGVSRLHYAVLTHGHLDHAGGLPAVLQAMAPAAFWDAGGHQHPLPLGGRRPRAGEVLRLGGARVEVLGPPVVPLQGSRSDLNANSIVLRISYGETVFLLTGDLEPEGEEALLRSGQNLRADVLKVAHHGSPFSSTAPFLAAVRPRIAVISTGPNRFGHPGGDALGRLRSAGAAVYRTDLHGHVTVEGDGRRLRVRTARRPAPAPGTPLLRRPLVGAW
jgi:competence protein ComEC